MRHFSLLFLSFLALTACDRKAAAPASGGNPAPAAAATTGEVDLPTGSFKVDPVHSTVLFRIKRDPVYFYGVFGKFDGQATFAADHTKSSIALEIDATSVDSRNERRNAHLKGPDFFNVKQFPKIAFQSTAIKAGGKGVLHVTGDLTLHGVKRPVELTLVTSGQSKSRQGKQSYGGETTLTIRRSEFGMKFMVGKGLGDVVRITVSLHLIGE